mmetsp:Transcript_41315/g.96393  ORF Transcript_41315/g.96393 Transcript_41315/m.96393 type:complete len:256 (+) Transcript_41315:234-1001(+)
MAVSCGKAPAPLRLAMRLTLSRGGLGFAVLDPRTTACRKTASSDPARGLGPSSCGFVGSAVISACAGSTSGCEERPELSLLPVLSWSLTSSLTWLAAACPNERLGSRALLVSRVCRPFEMLLKEPADGIFGSPAPADSDALGFAQLTGKEARRPRRAFCFRASSFACALLEEAAGRSSFSGLRIDFVFSRLARRSCAMRSNRARSFGCCFKIAWKRSLLMTRVSQKFTARMVALRLANPFERWLNMAISPKTVPS